METYLMLGKYTVEAFQDISKNRTEKAKDLFANLGGEIESMYALLGDRDLFIIAKFPDMQKAIKASIELGKMTKIAFTTSPAVAVEEFDNMFK
jgi:uncharacterized protein with GYD domain